MPATRSKNSKSNARSKSSIASLKQSANHAQRKSKKLSRGAEKARAAALKEELNSDVTGLHDIRPSRRRLGEDAEQQKGTDAALKAVEIDLQKMKQ